MANNLYVKEKFSKNNKVKFINNKFKPTDQSFMLGNTFKMNDHFWGNNNKVALIDTARGDRILAGIGPASKRIPQSHLKRLNSKVSLVKVGDFVNLSRDQRVPSYADEFKIIRVPTLFPTSGKYTLEGTTQENKIEKYLKQFIKSNAYDNDNKPKKIDPLFVVGQFIVLNTTIKPIKDTDIQIISKITINCDKSTKYRTINYVTRKIEDFDIIENEGIDTKYDIVKLKFQKKFFEKIIENQTIQPEHVHIFERANSNGFYFGGFTNYSNFNKENKNRRNYYINLDTEEELDHPFRKLVHYKYNIYDYLMPFNTYEVSAKIPKRNSKNNMKIGNTKINTNSKNVNIGAALYYTNTTYANNKFFKGKYTINRKLELQFLINKILDQDNPNIIDQANDFMNNIIDILIKKYNETKNLMIFSTLIYIIDQIYLLTITHVIDITNITTFNNDKRVKYLKKILDNFTKSNSTTNYFKDYIEHVLDAMEPPPV
jgi:hypothetical protein